MAEYRFCQWYPAAGVWQQSTRRRASDDVVPGGRRLATTRPGGATNAAMAEKVGVQMHFESYERLYRIMKGCIRLR